MGRPGRCYLVLLTKLTVALHLAVPARRLRVHASGLSLTAQAVSDACACCVCRVS
ncbi:hypothetical protein GCM10022416_63900 [Actinomadura keratinilytica]|uniref:Secreted protein n=1 Tax=Actinomadura keratinilytica TaxID=547461 RepID=A0ABP6UNE1_9ACTN